jgi:prepilin-type N-terminal cleavage/methylation domain-containing protein
MAEQRHQRRPGFALIEVVVALAILAGLVLAVAGAAHQQDDALRFFARLSSQSQRAQVLLGRIEAVLEDAQPASVDAFLLTSIDASSTTKLSLDTVAGFPDRGVLLVEPGTSRAERIGYEGLRTGGGARVLQLTRGLCGSAAPHAQGVPVLWSGAAFAIEQQNAPPASAFDGVSMEQGRPIFFRGEGTGFSFRKPVDLGQGVIDGLEPQWGADLGAGGLGTGRSAIVFVALRELSEAELGFDANSDRDRDDTFEVGELRLRTWDTNDGLVPPRDLGLGGSGILQERCNHGGDLDGDGFADPILLWHPDSGRVRVRLFLLVESERGEPQIQRVETSLCLRNPAEV